MSDVMSIAPLSSLDHEEIRRPIGAESITYLIRHTDEELAEGYQRVLDLDMTPEARASFRRTAAKAAPRIKR